MPNSNYFTLAGALTKELNFTFRNFRLKCHTKNHAASKGCSERIKDLCTHYSMHTLMHAHRHSKHKHTPVNEVTWTTQDGIKVGAQISLHMPAGCRKLPSPAHKIHEKKGKTLSQDLKSQSTKQKNPHVDLIHVSQSVFLMWTFLKWKKALPFPRAQTSSSLQLFLICPGGITDCCMFRDVWNDVEWCQESCHHQLICLGTL